MYSTNLRFMHHPAAVCPLETVSISSFEAMNIMNECHQNNTMPCSESKGYLDNLLDIYIDIAT